MDPPASPYAFVTVGTTKFESLIGAVVSAEFAAALRGRHGLTRVVVQVGNGVSAPGWKAGVSSWAETLHGLRFEFFTLKPSIRAEVEGASLVVCHAGAGSIFDALRSAPGAAAGAGAGGVRPLLVVVNTALADDHQRELADAMAARGHCVACLPETLAAALADEGRRLSALAPMGERRTADFESALGRLLGFEG